MSKHEQVESLPAPKTRHPGRSPSMQSSPLHCSSLVHTPPCGTVAVGAAGVVVVGK
jgi:hypothetical protein